MKSWSGPGLVAGMVCLGAGWALGQEAAQATPPSQATTPTPPAKIYDVGPDVTAPELLPRQWDMIAPGTCKEPKDGVVSLALVVDAEGAPQNVSVVSPLGTTPEKMALRIISADRFKPGTLRGDPVAVRSTAEVSIKGCFVTKTDDAGNTTEVFRLTAQPEQEFGATAAQKEFSERAAAIAAQPQIPGLFKVGNGVSAPVPLNYIEAEFSEEARRKHFDGVCLVSVVVDAEGKPRNARVIRALGAGLDEKAVEAVNKYRFRPAMKDGVPVPVMITVQVNFKLYEKSN